MRLARTLVIAAIVAALVAAFLVDEGDRPIVEAERRNGLSIPVAGLAGGIWFCPGGSSASGPAQVSLEVINAGTESAIADVTGVRSGSGAEPRSLEVALEPGERTLVRLADLVPDSAWMGAVVETTSSSVIVEQTYIGARGQHSELLPTDRAPCHTRTGSNWIVGSGATRADEFGEQMTLLVINPFLDDAVIDISYDSDVGVDSLDGVVIPARRVVAIDVNDPDTGVAVASRVSAMIEVRTGQVAVSRIQSADSESRAGFAVTPAAGEPASVWYLPTVRRGTRNDVITVVNPSSTDEADVDLEIIAPGDISFDPIELTIRPGRGVEVDLENETRLDNVEVFSVVARSLSGVPVAVMIDSVLPFGDGPVSNLSGSAGADAGATRWIAPVEADAGSIVLLNPSASTIATATVSVLVDGELEVVAEVEVGPSRRAEVASADLGPDRPIVVIEASSPLVVGREAADVSLHGLSVGIAAGTPVALIE